MFGNKLLDFNNDTSPFAHIDNLFLSQGEKGLGMKLLSSTSSLTRADDYRLIILSQISGGERIQSEFQYNSSGKLV